MIRNGDVVGVAVITVPEIEFKPATGLQEKAGKLISAIADNTAKEPPHMLTSADARTVIKSTTLTITESFETQVLVAVPLTT